MHAGASSHFGARSALQVRCSRRAGSQGARPVIVLGDERKTGISTACCSLRLSLSNRRSSSSDRNHCWLPRVSGSCRSNTARTVKSPTITLEMSRARREVRAAECPSRGRGPVHSRPARHSRRAPALRPRSRSAGRRLRPGLPALRAAYHAAAHVPMRTMRQQAYPLPQPDLHRHADASAQPCPSALIRCAVKPAGTPWPPPSMKPSEPDTTRPAAAAGRPVARTGHGGQHHGRTRLAPAAPRRTTGHGRRTPSLQ